MLSNDAKEIVKSLEGDAELIPLNLRKWWIEYLQSHSGHYLDTLAILEKYNVTGKIMEIGSTPGQFTVLLNRLGFDVRGVDINPLRIEPILEKYNLSVEKVDIEKEPLPFSDKLFDVVVFTQVLHHLRLNPLFVLREIKRILKPDGFILLSVPNITPIHRLDFLFGKSYQGNPVTEFKKLDWLGHVGVIRMYQFFEIREFLNYINFKIIYQTCKGEEYNKQKNSFLHKMIYALYPKKERLNKFNYVVAKQYS